MQDFRHIDAWAKAHQLALRVHEATRSFPKEELSGLTASMRRIALFIPMRIAEGCGYSTPAESGAAFRRGTAATNELEYAFLLARDLGYWTEETATTFTRDSTEVRKMVYGLLKKLG